MEPATRRYLVRFSVGMVSYCVLLVAALLIGRAMAPPWRILGALAVLAVGAIVGAWCNLSARMQRPRSSAVAPEGAMRSEGRALRGGDRLQALPILVYA